MNMYEKEGEIGGCKFMYRGEGCDLRMQVLKDNSIYNI